MKDMTNQTRKVPAVDQSRVSNTGIKKIEAKLDQLPGYLYRLLQKKSTTVLPEEAFLIFAAYAEMLVLYQQHVFSEPYVFNQRVSAYWKTISHYNNSLRDNFAIYEARALEYIHALQPHQRNLLILKEWLTYMKKADHEGKISQKNIRHYFVVLKVLNEKFDEIYACLKESGEHHETLQKVDWVKTIALRHSPEKVKQNARFEDLISDIIKNQRLIEESYESFTKEQKCTLGKVIFQEYEVISNKEREFIRTSTCYSFELVQYIHASKGSLFDLYVIESRYHSSRVTQCLSEVIDDILVEGLSVTEAYYLRQYLLEDQSPELKLSIIILSYSLFYQQLFSNIGDAERESVVTQLCQKPIFRQTVLEVYTDQSEWFCGIQVNKLQAVKAFRDLQEMVQNKKSFYQAKQSP